MRMFSIASAFLALLVCCASAEARPVRVPGAGGLTLNAEILLPDGPATGPAIVALHGCSGPLAARDRKWAEDLARAGHIVLLPDSYATRGLGSQCRVRDRTVTAEGLRRDDAIAAAVWLADQPGTPAGGIVLLGWSDGGTTALAVATARMAINGNGEGMPERLFRGFVTFYPGCRGAAATPGWKPHAPVLILMGELDDWTPIAPCRAMVGPMVRLIAYPGAYHDFDSSAPLRVMQNVPRSQNADLSVHTGGNPAAAEDARARVVDWIDHLPLPK